MKRNRKTITAIIAIFAPPARSLCKVVAAGALCLPLLVSTALADDPAVVLAPRAEMKTGEKYWSENKKFYAMFQDDGNLVVRNENDIDKWDIGRTQVGWPRSAGTKLLFQTDGNLVFQDPKNTYIWGSDQIVAPVANSTLNLSNSGAVLLLGPDGAELWNSSKSLGVPLVAPGAEMKVGEKYWSENKKFYAMFQDDGNLVVRHPGGLMKWDTFNNNKVKLTAKKLKLESTGRLVFLEPNGNVVWSSDKIVPPVANSTLNLSNSGDILLLSPWGALAWNGSSTYRKAGAVVWNGIEK